MKKLARSMEEMVIVIDGDNDDDENDHGKVKSKRSLFPDTLVRYTLRAQRAEQQDLMYVFSNRITPQECSDFVCVGVLRPNQQRGYVEPVS